MDFPVVAKLKKKYPRHPNEKTINNRLSDILTSSEWVSIFGL